MVSGVVRAECGLPGLPRRCSSTLRTCGLEESIVAPIEANESQAPRGNSAGGINESSTDG